MDSELRVQQNHLVEINIIPFKYKHLPLLLEMHKSQNYLNLSAINMQTLPKIGFIALMGDQPIAAGFLRRLEPCFAQLDTLVSNAYFGSQIRHQGISLVVDTLIKESKHLKLEGIIALTNDPGTLTRAADLGFHVVDQSVIAISLEK